MDSGVVVEWSREALKLAILLGGPLLLAAFLAALVIGALQTITQMQEPVVSQVPRMAAVALALLLLLPWLASTWVGFARGLIGGLAGG